MASRAALRRYSSYRGGAITRNKPSIITETNNFATLGYRGETLGYRGDNDRKN